MSSAELDMAVRRPGSRLPIWHRFGRDDRGATAIEFALVSIPFFIFLMCFIGCSLYFFMVSSLEKGMDDASRLIRTGQAVAQGMTVDQFRTTICQQAGGWFDCTKLQVWTQPYDNWSDISNSGLSDVQSDGVHNCLGTNETVLGNANYSSKIAQQAGSASDVVIVTVCYPWSFASQIPFMHFQTMQSGSMMLQSSTAFRTEPLPGAKS